MRNGNLILLLLQTVEGLYICKAVSFSLFCFPQFLKKLDDWCFCKKSRIGIMKYVVVKHFIVSIKIVHLINIINFYETHLVVAWVLLLR